MEVGRSDRNQPLHAGLNLRPQELWHRLLGGRCLSMGDYVQVRPIRRRHPALGSAQRPFVLATLEAEATPGSIEQLNVRVQSFVESLL